PRYGARPLARLFQREVADRVTDLLLAGPVRGTLLVVVADDGTQLCVTTATAATGAGDLGPAPPAPWPD
ncbi:MAG: hypothetical protein OXP66_03925, partial [Candidatus Tectomicrobia bacterium]|nr:hypothetical protein [Candidatus Tectomicrobia bacterium]